MKKIFNLLVVISLCGFMITGCSNAKKSDNENASATETPVTEVTEAPAEDASVGDIRPEFKEVMDSYEAFFDKYCEFMKNYQNSDDTSSMLADYADYMEEYTEFMEKINAIESETLSNDELAYYTEVVTRTTQKLADVTE